MSEQSTYTPVVTPREGASPEFVAVGQEYWSLLGFSEDRRPQWKVPVKEIPTHDRESTHVLAAAGVRAELPDVACSNCRRPLRLASRASLDTAMTGRPVSCADCDEQLQDRIARLVRPDAHKEQKRRELRERKQRQELYEQQLREWNGQRREVLSQSFSAAMHPEAALPEAGVLAELTALTVLRFADQVSPVTPVSDWSHDFPCYPQGTRRSFSEMLHVACKEGLLQPSPMSPVSAFSWVPETFETAYQEAGHDLDQTELPELSGPYRPLMVSWHVPYGSSSESAVQRLDGHLVSRLDPANMSRQRQASVLEVAQVTLAEEAERYFAHQLDFRKLPAVPEHHQTRLSEAIGRAVAIRPLGTVYYLAWLATKTAAASAHSQPRVPKENMTTFAVNRFEGDVQRALDEEDFPSSLFDEPIGCPLSAFTRTLFYSILELDPVRNAAGSLEQQLPPPVVPEGPELDEREQDPAKTANEENVRTGTTGWVTFTASDQSELLLRAGRYLAEQEEQNSPSSPPFVSSLHWQPPTRESDAYAVTLFIHDPQVPA